MEWSLSVTLDSVDVSAKVTGTVIIDGEESSSRIAQFTLRPGAGSIDVGDWIAVSVVIDFIADPNGSPVQTNLFTGSVNLATYDPVTRFTRFECIDGAGGLQGYFEAKTEAQILTAITGGKYSEAVFGVREDGWQQAQDVLSTVAKGYDLNRDGTTGVLTDWAAKVTPDYSYTASTIVDNSVKLELVRLRDLINQVDLSIQYRFTRLHHREHGYSWQMPTSFCEYFLDSYELPSRDMIQGAAEGAGWNVQNGSIQFGSLPASGGIVCGGGLVAWVITDENRDQLATSASWTAVKRWSQTITETYTLTVQESGSVTKFGARLYEDGAGYQTEFDDAGWDSDPETDAPSGWSVDAIGDYTEDQANRTDSAALIETLLQVADVKIKGSHRQNFVTFDVSLEPALERSHTVQMTSSTVTAKGKVYQVIHNLDLDQGTALTTIKLAVSKTGAGGSSDSLTAPAAPSTAPVHAAPDASTILPTRLGNDDTAPDYDDTWTGFTGNYTVAKGTPTEAQKYTRRFRLTTADIEDESRQEATGEKIQTYEVTAPDETLTISA